MTSRSAFMLTWPSKIWPIAGRVLNVTLHPSHISIILRISVPDAEGVEMNTWSTLCFLRTSGRRSTGSENRRPMNGTAFLSRIVIEKADDLIINCWVIEYFAQDLLAGSSGPDDEDTLAVRRFGLKPWEEPDPLPVGAVFECIVGADCHPDSTCHDEGEESIKEKTAREKPVKP